MLMPSLADCWEGCRICLVLLILLRFLLFPSMSLRSFAGLQKLHIDCQHCWEQS